MYIYSKNLGVQTGFNSFDEYLKSSNKLNLTIKPTSPTKAQKKPQASSLPAFQKIE
jgi:hypothetical protein